MGGVVRVIGVRICRPICVVALLVGARCAPRDAARVEPASTTSSVPRQIPVQSMSASTRAPTMTVPETSEPHALRRAVDGCLDRQGPNGRGHLRVVIAPSGELTSVLVEPPFAGTPVGMCLERALGQVRVAPFAGAAMTIGLGFERPRPTRPTFDRE